MTKQVVFDALKNIAARRGWNEIDTYVQVGHAIEEFDFIAERLAEDTEYHF
jgi:hypothetical protein